MVNFRKALNFSVLECNPNFFKEKERIISLPYKMRRKFGSYLAIIKVCAAVYKEYHEF